MGWDLFFKKASRNWARESSAKPRHPSQSQQPKMPTSLKEIRALKNSKPPKLTAPVGNKTKHSFFKPSLPFNLPVPVFTRGEIMGGAFIGEEERELARQGGQSERDALLRRTCIRGESIRDADLECDDDEDRQQVSRGRARKAAGATGETLTKTATSASQLMAVTAAANQLSRLAKRRR